MSNQVYRYVLCRPIPFPEVMSAFDLALVAVQSLHGNERTRLEARFAADAGKQVLAIDAGTPVGQALNQIFFGFARREFGEHAFKIERAERLGRGTTPSASTGAAA